MSVEIATDIPTDPARVREIEREIAQGSAQTAYAKLADEPDAIVAEVLGRMLPPHALQVLDRFHERRREAILEQVPKARRRQWEINASHPDESVGRLMALPVGIFPPETKIRDAVEGLREAVKTAFISYIHVTDPGGPADRCRRDARDAPLQPGSDPRRHHDPQALLAAGERAGRRRHARGRAATLPGLSRRR